MRSRVLLASSWKERTIGLCRSRARARPLAAARRRTLACLRGERLCERVVHAAFPEEPVGGTCFACRGHHPAPHAADGGGPQRSSPTPRTDAPAACVLRREAERRGALEKQDSEPTRGAAV